MPPQLTYAAYTLADVTSPTTKAKLRILFEVAPIGLLVRGAAISVSLSLIHWPAQFLNITRAMSGFICEAVCFPVACRMDVQARVQLS